MRSKRQGRLGDTRKSRRVSWLTLKKVDVHRDYRARHLLGDAIEVDALHFAQFASGRVGQLSASALVARTHPTNDTDLS
jgi:hypothetical protein